MHRAPWQLEQRGAARVGPGLVAILGQQLAGVEVERGLVGGGLAGGARAGGGGLEGVDVDLGLEGDDAVAEAQGVGRRSRGARRAAPDGGCWRPLRRRGRATAGRPGARGAGGARGRGPGA